MMSSEPNPGDVSAWSQWHSFDFMAIDRRRDHESHNRILVKLAEAFATTRFSLLDVGVLSTVTLEKLSNDPLLDVSYVGIDISFPIVRDAQRRHPDVAWIQATVEAMPFPDGSFDCVLVRHVLEHLEDPMQAIREAARVSRQMVILCFFLPPAEHEQRRRDVYDDGVILHNVWERSAVLSELGRLFSTVTPEYVDDWYRPNELMMCLKREARAQDAIGEGEA